MAECEHDYAITGEQFCTKCGLPLHALPLQTPEYTNRQYEAFRDKIWAEVYHRTRRTTPLGKLSVNEWGKREIAKGKLLRDNLLRAYWDYIL